MQDISFHIYHIPFSSLDLFVISYLHGEILDAVENFTVHTDCII